MEVESFKDMWEIVRTELQKEVTDISYRTWLQDIKPVEMKDGVFILSAPNSYKKGIIESTFTGLLKTCIERVMSVPMEIKLVLEGEPIIKKTENLNPSFEESFTFDNFIVGQTNRFAHAAAMAVADRPAVNSNYNPLVIYGPSGVGKTHLLLAIKNQLASTHPEYKVEFVRCEEFTNQLIHALQEGKLGLGTIEDFRNRYRNVDVLLIDDIQFIAGKEATQEEFFNNFNTLLQNNRQIVVTLDRPPKDIATLENRIRSRFESGLLANITPADFETRVGIINGKAEQLGIKLPEHIVYEIAKKIIANTRQLEGVVKKLQVFVQLEGKEPSLADVHNFIRDVISDTKPEPIKIERIVEQVAHTYRVSEADILSKRKTADLVFARQVAMYVARETTELPYKAIGESFGKDHSTVLYNVRKIEDYLKDRPYEKSVIDEIFKKDIKKNKKISFKHGGL